MRDNGKSKKNKDFLLRKYIEAKSSFFNLHTKTDFEYNFLNQSNLMQTISKI
jgi:hypothetical protein